MKYKLTNALSDEVILVDTIMDAANYIWNDFMGYEALQNETYNDNIQDLIDLGTDEKLAKELMNDVYIKDLFKGLCEMDEKTYIYNWYIDKCFKIGGK